MLQLVGFGCDALPRLTVRKRPRRCVRVRGSAEKETASAEPSAKNDILERIAKAKAYKAERDAAPRPAGPSAFGDELERPEESARRLSEADFRARFNDAELEGSAPGFREATESTEDAEQAAVFEGTADRAASFLPSDDAQPTKRPDVRPEDFALEEEERRRSRGADVISVDKSYRPKVSTWGMYPRPANISEAFGGGRRIDPTQPLEAEDVTEERRRQIAQALIEYKKQKGLYVEPEVEAQYREVFDEGEARFESGALTAAAAKFDDASKIVDFKTRFGGDARLKHAICLDSLGKSKPAKAIYEQLTKHPQSDIRTQARRMLFGFKAMDHLKVAQMQQTSLSTEYAEYFAKLPKSWNSTYLDEEDEALDNFDEGLKLALWLSGMILLFPLVFVLMLASS